MKVEKEYLGRVGETLDFVCRKDKKVFQTNEIDLMDNVLTILCKPDRYYTVPSSGVRNENGSSGTNTKYVVFSLQRTGRYVRLSATLKESWINCPRRRPS